MEQIGAPKRVLLFGATGTIGRATAVALVRAGHRVTCVVRQAPISRMPPGVTLVMADATDRASLYQALSGAGQFDAILSCMASRSGSPTDAWAVDHDAHHGLLAFAIDHGIGTFVLLSAICVQRPKLAFQHAKLAFEKALQASGLTYSIVRPTAYFKSLSGQVGRLRAGKPFLLFGDGALTACKPISDRDLGDFLARCVTDPSLQNRVLPIGGPGPALTAREQGEALFAAMGLEPKFRSVPVAMMDGIIGVLGTLGHISRTLADKAEFARIGRYYATESMLVWNEATQAYDADATPETGQDRLQDHYAALARGEVSANLGAHAVFET